MFKIIIGRKERFFGGGKGLIYNLKEVDFISVLGGRNSLSKGFVVFVVVEGVNKILLKGYVVGSRVSLW